MLVGFVPSALFYFAASNPFLKRFYLAVWVFGFVFDVYTTYRLHRRFPGGMERFERCGYMRLFHRLFGFWGGVAAYALLVEAPIVLLMSFAVIPASERVFSLLFTFPKPEPYACVASSLCFFGLAHLSAVPENLEFKP
jgi:hypothetical protein